MITNTATLVDLGCIILALGFICWLADKLGWWK